MRIIAADSSTAILNERFEPLTIVATAAVVVDQPYREPEDWIAKPIYADASNGHEVVVGEVELCQDLLEKAKADVVHVDMSLGATSLEELSPIQFTNMKISVRAKRNLLKILPKIRKTAGEISRKYGINVLAIGKESIPVRIAELTSGAHAILYSCEKATKENHRILVGLPQKCQPSFSQRRVDLCSLIGAEHDVKGFAGDSEEIMKKVDIAEMLNPVARGFRILEINPRK